MAHLMTMVLTGASGHDQVAFNSGESRTIRVPTYTTPQDASSSSSAQSQSTSTPRTASSATTPQTVTSDDRSRRYEEAYIERLRASK